MSECRKRTGGSQSEVIAPAGYLVDSDGCKQIRFGEHGQHQETRTETDIFEHRVPSHNIIHAISSTILACELERNFNGFRYHYGKRLQDWERLLLSPVSLRCFQ